MMATTRIRKTFHYPDSSDDEDTVEAGLDAQDQAALLDTLQTRDTTSTRLYTLLLLVFPATIFIFTLPHLFALTGFFPSLLALASLAASAYTLYYLPLPAQSAGILVDGHHIHEKIGKRKAKRRAVGGYGLSPATSATASARSEERCLGME
ncbi:hypothetical protein N0V91_004902 [Didymella pomorum]|uniref:Uncharacterized protein n=1 Tax=Didymella pomorum TaxID=749634 RepID=A0A9W8ZDA5_9PLEO|nr:hypothetical protein N0V91_004902 [Didymella pomorum]